MEQLDNKEFFSNHGIKNTKQRNMIFDILKVTGKVQKGELKGQVMPVIVAETVETTSKPKSEIVY